ncbi:DUF4347 domain-containing protein [Myxococcus sp. AS-1-15]|uniref:DUF4347 domain-containing protein n=1 Tax=Myxococcus sp. AS-1-15 TaxID=2874600 RepID=UPI001CC19B58|nr:DUF4347 domain-containing protein [Myxococcus sp. AS-1-15]MBZ4399860.1 DUF4347 domain-containing protein [Myxococcus sp. AS-1-15]
MHLTIIAYASTLDWEVERAVFLVDEVRDARRRFERCQKVENLQHVVKEAVSFARAKLSRLDIFGHGQPGTLTLGDSGEDIVTPDEASWKHLLALDGFLDDTAELRLLGCDTAVGVEGRHVLQGLQAGLSKNGKQRTVWGTIATLSSFDFGPQGFREAVASAYLRSASQLTEPAQGVLRFGLMDDSLQEEIQAGLALLPEGYVPAGFHDMHGAIVEERSQKSGRQLTMLAARRLIAISSNQMRGVALYRWEPTVAPPSRQVILSHSSR